VDGKAQQDHAIPLFDDHKEHWVEVRPAVFSDVTCLEKAD